MRQKLSSLFVREHKLFLVIFFIFTSYFITFIFTSYFHIFSYLHCKFVLQCLHGAWAEVPKYFLKGLSSNYDPVAMRWLFFLDGFPIFFHIIIISLTCECGYRQALFAFEKWVWYNDDYLSTLSHNLTLFIKLVWSWLAVSLLKIHPASLI